MSILGVICLALSLVCTVLVVLYVLQRRDQATVEELAMQLERIVAASSSAPGRLYFQTEQPELYSLGNNVNQLLARYAALAQRQNASPRLFQDLADRMHEVVLLHRGVILFANQQFASLLGVDRVNLAGRSLEELVAPEFAELVADNLRKRLAGEEPAPERLEIEMVGFQGQVSRLEISSTRIDFEGAPALLITGVEVVQTSTLAALGLPLAAPEAELRGGGAAAAPEVAASRTLAMESIAEPIVTTDQFAKVEYLNPAAESLLGVTREQAQGRKLDEIVGLVDEGDRKALSDPINQVLASGMPVNLSRRAIMIARGDGAERSIEMSASPMRGPDGQVVGAALVLRDVSEMRGLARQMSYQATHDALTGLVNRREFERRLEEAVDGARRGDNTHVLCYLDLDRFKIVNDTSGHMAGDSLLRDVAKVLRDAVRDSDTVARVGGDEFAVLLIGCPLDKARQIADDMCRSIGEYRFVWKDRVFQIGVSIGIVELARESGTAEESLAAADSACYVAKKQGTGNVSVYSARDEALARHTGEILWLQKLQAALTQEKFELHCQPIVPVSPQVSEGPAMEMLLRLKEDGGRQVAPSEFLKAAERYRLMGHIDRWVVAETLKLIASGRIKLAPGRSVAINVAGQTLGDTQFLEFVVETLDRTGIPPSQICFEMTENAVLANLDHARRFVAVLHGMGCKFSLDDFGSGVGSFSNLKNLPMDYLKIDGTFTRNLSRDPVSQAMVGAMIKLARTLNFKVIAEQLEDEAALDTARRMGVDFVQGYIVARPAALPLAA